MQKYRKILVALCAWLGMQGAALAQDFSWHDRGLVPYQAAKLDPRFPYMMYVPKDYDENGDKDYPLVVLVHGTERGAHYYLERNAEFAEDNDLILLAPLFPVSSHGRFDLENYKLLDHKGTRYDLVLLSMVDEVRSKYRIRDGKFSMFGFSGGGHFAHRFFYLHPHHLNAVSIGAPGIVTLIDEERPWWVGTGDLNYRFNARMNLKEMARVKVQMIIGAEDKETWEDEIEPAAPYYLEGVTGASYNAAGANRIERLHNLKDNFEQHGIAVTLEMVPAAGHDETRMFPGMQTFLLEHLR